jgi:hypothetical protein
MISSASASNGFCADLHRRDGRRHIAVSGNHDDRRVACRVGDTLEQFHAGQAGKLVVEDDAGRLAERDGCEIFFGRGVGPRHDPGGRQKHGQRIPNRCFIIDDMHAALIRHNYQVH